MRKALLFVVLLVFSFTASQSQNLSYTCPRDTVLGCGVNCLDLKVTFPDLRGLGDQYTLSNVSQQVKCYPIVPPGGPGPSSNIEQDDFYSPVIPLPFTFRFYGINYNSLLIGPNGTVSFDISEAENGTHWEDFGDLPNVDYDRAIIMGPYHDIDISVPSPGKQIKYNVYGTAPNRKWILSYYRVALFEGFNNECKGQLRNTHQIILHEGSNIIETVIVDKEICTGWNNGKAMIGLQNYNRDKAIMAPGRRMTDPPWGSIGMNETWRFIPTNGTHLYQGVQLLNAAGTVIATGDTTRVDANTLGWTFPNVCPPTNAPTLYVVKTTYQRQDNPALTYFSLDSVYVTRNAFPVSASATSTTCGASTGTITVTHTGGTAPFTYSLDGNPPQASNVFTNLPTGPYTITVTDNSGCDNITTVNVGTTSSLTGTFTRTNVSCPGNSDGSITITPTSGAAPYTYSANGAPPQASNVFTNLPPGPYIMTFTDANGCIGTIPVTLTQGSAISGSATSTATSCAGANNGTITAVGLDGVGPYIFAIDGGTFQPTGVFTGLTPGPHTVIVQDSRGCQATITRNVGTGAGLSANALIVNASCATASNGSITVTPTNGNAPYSYSLNGGTFGPSNLFSGLAPGPYTITIRDANNCSGTISRTVLPGAGVTSTNNTSQTSCPSINDGSITITPTNGTAPFSFSLDGGAPQATGIFNGVSSGPHTVIVTDANSCTGTVSVNVTAGPFLQASVVTAHQPVCANINDGSITITPTTGVAPYSFTITPGPTQVSPTFNNLAPGNYTYNFTDAAGCTGFGVFALSSNPALRSPSVKVMPLCNGDANGRITFNTGGGVGPYQYALSPFTTFQASNVFNGLIAGTYTFRIKDNVGCTKDTTIVLAEPTTLTASATNSKVATCNGNDGTITVTRGGGTAPYQYSINNGINYQAPNIFIAPDTGFYPSIKVKDSKGCIANATTTVALNDTMRLELGVPQTICVESSVTLQPQTNAGTTIFNWTAQGQPISTLSSAVIKNPVATPVDTVTYTLLARWGVCTRQDVIIINVLHKPIVNAGLDTAICNQATQTIPAVATLNGSARDTSGTVNYLWTPSGKVSFPNQAVTPAKTDSTQKFTLTVTDNYGCNFTVRDTVIVFVQAPVKAFAGRDTIAMLNRPHQLMATGGTGYLWNPSGPLNDPAAQNPLATLQADTRFTVVVTDIAGCEGYDTVFVKAYEGPTYYIPNAFSPNGDGRNDIFRAVPAGLASTEYFRVFNRFGVLMFETNQWLKGWDGTYRGKKQPVGTYVWMIRGKDRSGRTIEQKGTVVIVQ